MEGGQSLLVATPASPKYSMLVKVLCAVAVAATVGIAYTAGSHSVGQGAVTNFASFSDVDANILRSMNMQEAAYGDISDDEDDEDAYGQADEDDEDDEDAYGQVKKSNTKSKKVRCSCKAKKATKKAAYGFEDESEDDEDAEDAYGQTKKKGRYVAVKKLCKLYCRVRKISMLKGAKK
jgi:cobalamin biosynthesis protein CobT